MEHLILRGPYASCGFPQEDFLVDLLYVWNLPLQASESEGADANMSEIARFYSDKNVFITGATGFMGKVMALKSYCHRKDFFTSIEIISLVKTYWWNITKYYHSSRDCRLS